jgi:cytosine/adenosine deaminase-related metal-dependent hydrolase
VRRVADAGAWIVQNPRSNRGNRVGYGTALACSPRVALGTDGYPADMREELRVAVEAGAAHGDGPDVGAARLARGEALAAELLGLSPAPAITAVGRRTGWVDRARARCLSRLVVDGRTIIERGQLLTADLDAIREDARREAARLWRRLSEVAP